MLHSRRDTFDFVFLGFAVVFVALAAAGAIRAYSPVPFWDMWNGYLEFYIKANSGDWSVWWAQHNEHRILLARILFWIDLAFFQGAGWFLILLNYALLALVCLVFLLAWQELSDGTMRFVSYFLVAWLFSWSQHENLIWGFQSQFILAQLLPLSAFYLLHKSASNKEHSSRYFVAATACGLLAIGSMANGVLALPLLTLLSLLVGSGWRRSGILAALSIIGLWGYFHGYVAPAGHGSLSQAVKENPVGMIEFVLVYLGGPFYFLVKGGSFGLLLAKVAGAGLILGSVLFAWRALKAPAVSTLQLALLFFVLYVGGTAFGTAGGRLSFGLEQAVASRYMTPVLMVWVALAVQFVPMVNSIPRWAPHSFLLILLGLMLPQQLSALQSRHDLLFERNLAALALELGVKDQAQIGNVWLNADATLSIAKSAVERNLSVFGMKPLIDLREQIGRQSEINPTITNECLGNLDETQGIIDTSRFLKVQGWIFNPLSHDVPRLLSLVDDGGKTVGFAVSGQSRPDVRNAMGKEAGKSGFRGYLLSENRGNQIFMVAENTRCRLAASVPILPYKLLNSDYRSGLVTVSAKNLLDGNQWLGKDSQRSSVSGLVILGSYIRSDADQGSVSLLIRRGDRFFYRSGPTGGRQILEVLDTDWPPLVLPVAQEWSLIEFSSEQLPDRFRIKLSDLGSGWGEWSAVMLGDTK